MLKRALLAVIATLFAAMSLLGAKRVDAEPSPIQRIVIIYMENHSFDNVFGRLCVQDARCDGVTEGKISTGATIPLMTSPDVIPTVGHSRDDQEKSINGGGMDNFDLIQGCKAPAYDCYSQFEPSQIPNVANLARTFAISDATFENSLAASYVAHLVLLSSDPLGFYGNNPGPGTSIRLGPGWGCNSKNDALWTRPSDGENIFVPSCIPDQLGRGPYRPSPVPYAPTIIERMEDAGLSWKLYSAEGPRKTGQGSGYLWAPCTYFYTCLNTMKDKWVPAGKFDRAAETGKLPKLSIITPRLATSQHNGRSMLVGDNWIGELVGAVMNGPQWLETTIFITWDDPGGFYDHAPPPPGRGIRVPMVIVSPYAKAGFTDHNFATFNSMLAYIEHTFGLEPLTAGDANAYDFSDSFNYTQVPIEPVRMILRKLPPWEQRYLATHPVDERDDLK